MEADQFNAKITSDEANNAVLVYATPRDYAVVEDALRKLDTPPTQEKVTPRPWWKPHRPNLTGTPAAQRPIGSTLAQGRRPKATGDYKPWIPGR